MKRKPKVKIGAVRNIKLPMLALAAQKCELQPGNIMIGILAFVGECQGGATVEMLNQLLFAGARRQLAEQMLVNGVSTGELRKEGDRYFLSEFGLADLKDKKAWVNGQTASWELLCLGNALGGEVDVVMRDLAVRVKMEAGWRTIEDYARNPDARGAAEVWDKIRAKIQLRAWHDGSRQGILLVDEFAEPPKPSASERILVRVSNFELTLELLDNENWVIDSLEYTGENDRKFSESFDLKGAALRVDGPDLELLKTALEANGLKSGTAGSLCCPGGGHHEIDPASLVIPELQFKVGAWEVFARDVPVIARDQAQALSWFARYLAMTCGPTIPTWGEIRSMSISYLKMAGVVGPVLDDADLRSVVVEALGMVGRRGDASRLGYILDFE